MEVNPLQMALLALLLPFVTEGVKSSIENWGGGQLKERAGVIAVWVVGLVIAIGATAIQALPLDIKPWVSYFAQSLAAILASQGVFVTARSFNAAIK